MEVLLEKVTQHAMNYAIRSGIAITSGYAIQQCSKLLRTVDSNERAQIALLQARLESKIRIIAPAIDMIDLIAARGNTSLESAVNLTKAIRYEIQTLGSKLGEVLAAEGRAGRTGTPMGVVTLNGVVADLKRLLEQIEDAVPLINLAITTSGVNLSTTLPASVSPSRLLQASTFLSAGDSAYSMAPNVPTQIGPVFVLSLYLLFEGHANRIVDHEGAREATWQEVVHKARVKLLRVPLDNLEILPGSKKDPLKTSTIGHSNAEKGDFFPRNIPSDGKAHEFAYQILIIEDLDDDRVHTFEDKDEQPGPYDDVAMAGIREIIPIHQVSKIFYADTGKILNIGSEGESNNPVLLLKRDVNAIPPRRMDEQKQFDEEYDSENEPNNLNSSSNQKPHPRTTKPSRWSFPAGLDPEWLALEVYVEPVDTDESEPELEEPSPTARKASYDPISATFSRLRLGRSNTPSSPSPAPATPNSLGRTNPKAKMTPVSTPTTPLAVVAHPSGSIPNLKTSLSLLELLIRLTALQQFQQASHLSISDELLNFFLSESSSTGAGADAEHRKRVRNEARRIVGFDPYAESPVRIRRESDWDGVQYEDNGYEDGWQYDHRSQRGSMPPGSSPLTSPIRGYLPKTPGSTRSRTEVLRQQAGGKYSSSGRESTKGSGNGGGLVRSSSDSTLGTSPSGPGAKEG